MKRLNLELSRYVEQASALQKPGQQLARTIHKWVLQGGEPVRRLADLLHGTWLGHPLHPVLTDVVVGAWSLGALFDLISLRSPSRRTRQAADTLTAVGIVAALPTAPSGVADFSTIPQSAAGTGLARPPVKASLGTFILSLWARKKRRRGQGLFCCPGAGSDYSGGLSRRASCFGKRVGVNRSERLSQPKPGPRSWPGRTSPNSDQKLSKWRASRCCFTATGSRSTPSAPSAPTPKAPWPKAPLMEQRFSAPGMIVFLIYAGAT